MATITPKETCILCKKIRETYLCQGCSNRFCFPHLSEHRTNIAQEFDQLQNNHDQLRQQIHDFQTDLKTHPSFKQINQWEQESIEKIKQQAKQRRSELINYSSTFFLGMERKLNDLAKQMKDIHQEDAFNETDLENLKQGLKNLEIELSQPIDISTEQQSTSCINTSSFISPFRKDSRWKQYATTIAGVGGQGNQCYQLDRPDGISIDDHKQLIYIVDCDNHRILEWKLDTNTGRIVAGGNGQGNQLDQLNEPTDVTIDRQNNDLIIADRGNSRVLRWPRHSSSPVQIIIHDIICTGLAMQKDGTLYVSDHQKNQVTRWKRGEKHGTIVAGGNGKGNQLNQLNSPTFLFIDDNHTLYVSDTSNDRVMKWVKDAKEGTIVAGGNGGGNQLTQLDYPQGVIVDQFGQIYVADCLNHRVMQWCEGEKQGTIVAGTSDQGQEKNQLDNPVGLSFDRYGNLYVADWGNDRIEKFERDF